MVQFRLGIAHLLLCACLTVRADTPPSFTHNLPEDSIGVLVEGKTATFYCKATGDRPLQYRWISSDLQGNTRDLTLDARYTFHSDGRLTISNAQHAKDDGYYHCVARNNVGTAISRCATFRVAYLTIVSSSGTSQAQGSMYQHYKYTLASTDSFPPYPKTRYDWRKTGATLKETDKISFSTAGNLYLSNLDFNDIARYESTVMNTVTGTSYTRPSLILSIGTGITNVKSSILLGPSHQIAVSGKNQEVTFECFVTGNPMPTITWKKNGNPISTSAKYELIRELGGNLDKRLKIKNIQTFDEGKYSCEVSNPRSDGAGKWIGDLTVYTEPTLISGPSDATRYPDNSVTFSCSARGKPTPVITWYNNGRRVFPSSRETISSHNSDYTISKVQAQDGGVIQCVAGSAAGHVMARARLTLLGVPIWITLPPQDRSVTMGETVVFQCKTRGNPTATVTWNKGSSRIDTSSPSTRFHQTADGSLQITNTKREDSGTYTCIATNSKGTKTASAILRVLSQTNITVQLPARSIAIKGYTKILVVGVAKDAIVSLRFTWTKDGSAITEPRITVLSNGSLSIAAVHDSDAGTYKCVVSSAVGNASTSTVLVVQEKPLSPSRPLVSQRQSTSLRLTWNPPGYTGNSRIISYTVEMQKENDIWKVMQDNINPSSSQVSAVIVGLSPFTRYRFRVRAINEVGAGQPSDATPLVTTFSAAPSAAPTDIKGQPSSAQAFVVSWKVPPPETHNGQLLGYRINYRLSGVSGQAFNVKVISEGLATQGSVDGLLLWTEYEVKVQAFNNAGSSPFSSRVIVTTGEGVPTAPVQDLKIIGITTTTVQMEWKPPPQRQWNGRLKGFKLLAWQPHDPSAIVRIIVGHDSSKAVQRGTLINLRKFTQYEVVVVAFNSAGDSPRSAKKLIKTEEGIPTAVSSFSVSDVYSDGFTVSWSPPTQINGNLLAYVVKHWRNDSQLVVSEQSTKNFSVDVTVTGLNPNTWYAVTIAARTGAGLGASKKLYVRTVDSPVLPGTPGKPQFISVKAWTVSLRWVPGFSGRAPIQKYTIQYNNDLYFNPGIAIWRTVYVVNDAHRVSRLFPLEVPNLRPYTVYRFRVIATNKVGSSSPSNASDSARTQEAAPSLPPSELSTHKQVAKGVVEIRWKIPPEESWNSLLIGYIIQFEPSSSSQHTLTITVPNARTTYYMVGGLLSYTRYTITIRSYNLNGKGVSNSTALAYFVTDQDAPDQPPSNVRAIVRGPKVIIVDWGPIPEIGRNGEILGYQVHYKVQGQAIEKVKKVEGSATYSASIDGLESFVIYEFQVLGYTRFGLGPRSQVVRAKTEGSIPGPPVRLRFPEVTYSWVKLTWDPPIYPHGNITGFWVKYKLNTNSSPIIGSDNNIDPRVRTKVYTSLSSRVYYKFYVQAKTRHGWGPAAEEVIYTTNIRVAPDQPFIFPIPTSAIKDRAVLIEWRVNEHPTSPMRYFTLQFDMNNGGWLIYPRIIEAKLRKMTVEGLLPGARYRFRIMATNDVGNSPFSSPSQEVSTIPIVPTGAPRDVRITASSPQSLLVEWSAPLPGEVGGTIEGFKLKYKKGLDGNYNQISLSATQRAYTITGLDVFAKYYVKMAVVNEKGEGMNTPDLPATTGEMVPTSAPSDVRFGLVTMTSVSISWTASSPESVRGLLQGYKVYYLERAGRRRRRLVYDAPCKRETGPQYMDVRFDKTSANVTNLRKYVTYGFWVTLYNSKGESPSTATQYKTTQPDLPGPVHNFHTEAVYNTRVDLRWEFPCEPNGVMQAFEIMYGKPSQMTKTSRLVPSSSTSVVITGLEMLTQYSFYMKPKNQLGYGPMSFVPARTKGPAVLPGRPGKPVVKTQGDTALITWQNGHSGNVPFTKFEIQSRTGKGAFQTHWNFKPEDTSKNKTFASCTVGNLDLYTSYQFRIIAWNQVGASPPSEPSHVATTGGAAGRTEKRVYQQTWFITLITLFAVILLLVIIGFVFIQRRRRKERYKERLSTAGSTSTRNTTDTSIRSGILPGVQITYRDPDEAAEVSSISDKEELSQDSGVSDDEGFQDYPVRSGKADDSFVAHYANDPNHQSWRNSLGRPAKGKEIEEGMDIVDGSGRPRFKSFTSDENPPPAYDSHVSSSESLHMIRANLPPEAVTSFMSPEYEAKKSRDLMRHSPFGSQDAVVARQLRGGSRERLEPHNNCEQLNTSPHGSRDHIRPSSRESRDNIRPSPRGSRDNIRLSPKGNKDNNRPSPRGSRENIRFSQRGSRDDIVHSPRGSRDDIVHSPRGSRDDIVHSPRGSRDNIVHSPRGSRDNILHSPRGSRDHLDDLPDSKHINSSYGKMPKNRRGEARRSSFRQALGGSGRFPSEESDWSSSSNDNTADTYPHDTHNTTTYPRVQLSEEPGKRHRKPPSVDPNPSRSRDKYGSFSSGAPPISPAPSYNSTADPFAVEMRPVSSQSVRNYDNPRRYGDRRRPEVPPYPTARTPPVVMVIEDGFGNTEMTDTYSLPQVSSYQSFV